MLWKRFSKLTERFLVCFESLVQKKSKANLPRMPTPGLEQIALLFSSLASTGLGVLNYLYSHRFTHKHGYMTWPNKLCQAAKHHVPLFLPSDQELGNLNKYRFHLNVQRVGCLEGLGLQPIEGLVPEFSTDFDPTEDPDQWIGFRREGISGGFWYEAPPWCEDSRNYLVLAGFSLECFLGPFGQTMG